MNQLMKTKNGDDENKTIVAPVVVIIDCSLVLGIDSSTAQAITKLKDRMVRRNLPVYRMYKIESVRIVASIHFGQKTADFCAAKTW
jgi:hypothetical protein